MDNNELIQLAQAIPQVLEQSDAVIEQLRKNASALEAGITARDARINTLTKSLQSKTAAAVTPWASKERVAKTLDGMVSAGLVKRAAALPALERSMKDPGAFLDLIDEGSRMLASRVPDVGTGVPQAQVSDRKTAAATEDTAYTKVARESLDALRRVLPSPNLP